MKQLDPISEKKIYELPSGTAQAQQEISSENSENKKVKLEPKKKRQRQNITRKYLRARWKHFLSQDSKGELLIEGIPITQIVKKYSSPLYVIIEEEIREKCRKFLNGFDYPLLRPQYACKCNSNLEVLRIIREEGFDFDASSVGEIILGLLADFEPSQVTFTNLYKTEKDILFALTVGVKSITIDSMEELDEAINAAHRAKKECPILLRVNPMISEGKFTTKKQQYGIHYNDAKKAVLKVKSEPLIKLKGFHFHGSYAHNFRGYFLAAEKLMRLMVFAREEGLHPDTIDLGGGFPVEAPEVYRPGKYFTPKEFGDKFIPYFKRLCERNEIPLPILIFEPGKSIVANSGIGIISVVSNKKREKKEIVVTDGSCYSMFPDVLVSHCDYEMLPATKMRTKSTYKYDISGSTCDCIDVIATCQKMPKLTKGDLIAVMDCGAYSFVMGSNFNNLKLAPITMINAKGEIRLIRRRDRYTEIFGPELDVLKVAGQNEMKRFYDLLRRNYEGTKSAGTQ
ncbi:MAG: hypothetical protein AABW59_01750 [archaeon]